MSAVAPTLDRRDAIDTTAAGLMLLLTLSWGLAGVAGKVSNRGFDPVFVTVARSLIGGLLVFAWCRWRGIALFERDGTLWAGLLVGTMFGVEFLLIFKGLDYTSVARNTLLVNAMPFWVLLGAHLFLGERLTTRRFAGMLLAFGGLVLVFSDKLSLPGPDAVWGDLLSLAAGIVWAATNLVIKGSRLTSVSAEKLLLYQLSVSSVLQPRSCPLPEHRFATHQLRRSSRSSTRRSSSSPSPMCFGSG